jgi:hypothetical protein
MPGSLANGGLAGTSLGSVNSRNSAGVVGPHGYATGTGNSANMGSTGTGTANGTQNGAQNATGEFGEQSEGLAGEASTGASNSQTVQPRSNAMAKGQTKAGDYGYTAGQTQGSDTADAGNSSSGQVAQNGKANGTAPPEDSAYRDVKGGSDSAMGPAGGEGGPGFTMTSSNASKSKPAGQEDKNAKPQNNSVSGPSGTGVVVSRGNDWTRQNIRGTAVERTIRIRCQEDRWVIQPEPGQQGTKTIFLRKGLVQARTDLSKALQGRVDSWGMALAGGYWKPKVVVAIDPNAQHRYEQLQRVLQGSGIDVTEEETPNGQKPR